MERKVLTLDYDGFIYQFYAFIRSFYAKDAPERSNLCYVFQSTFWGMLGLVVLFPVFLFSIPFRLLFHKVMYNKVGIKALTGTGTESPPANQWLQDATSTMILFCPIYLGILIYLGFDVIWNIICNTPWFIGMVVYFIFSLIGGFFEVIILNTSLWRKVGGAVLEALKWLLFDGTLGFVVAFPVYLLSKSQWGKRLDKRHKKISFGKASDFKEKWEQATKKLGWWTCNRCKAKMTEDTTCCVVCSWRPFGKVLNSLTYLKWRLNSKRVSIGNATVVVLSPFGALWEFLKSVKQGLCPLIEFRSMDEVMAERNSDLFKLGQCMMKMGMINRYDLHVALTCKKDGEFLGDYLVREKKVTRDKVREALKYQASVRNGLKSVKE